jgi:RNA polymerase sigma-70 factor (ECF subfamily)
MKTAYNSVLKSMNDMQLACHIKRKNPDAIRLLVQRNNQQLYRAAMSILNDSLEAEDVVQTTYLKALDSVSTFKGRSGLSSWLTRIAINEALERRRKFLRRKNHLESMTRTIDLTRSQAAVQPQPANSPDHDIARKQIRNSLELAIAELPEKFRSALMLREVQMLSTEAVADILGISEPTVRTRILRARKQLRSQLSDEYESLLSESFPFGGHRCARITNLVLNRICAQHKKLGCDETLIAAMHP